MDGMYREQGLPEDGLCGDPRWLRLLLERRFACWMWAIPNGEAFKGIGPGGHGACSCV